MTIPAIAPSLRPLFALSACSPCDGGNDDMLVVEASLAEFLTFDGEDSLVVDDNIIVAIVGRFSKIDMQCSSWRSIAFCIPAYRCR